MKTFLAGIGVGFVLGFVVAMDSSLVRRVRALLCAKPYYRRYLWRDPETRLVSCERTVRERTLDKTLADSFPASDPPSSLPDPCEDSMVA